MVVSWSADSAERAAGRRPQAAAREQGRGAHQHTQRTNKWKPRNRSGGGFCYPRLGLSLPEMDAKTGMIFVHRDFIFFVNLNTGIY